MVYSTEGFNGDANFLKAGYVNVMSVLMQLSILMLMMKLMLILMLMLVTSEHLMLVFHFGHLSPADNAHFCVCFSI